MKQMAEKQGVTESPNEQEQMKWGALMNNIKTNVEESVLKDIVYV